MAEDGTESRPGWFTFTVEDADSSGIEIPKLTHLLDDLSSAFYTIARAKKGRAARRPGPRALAEELLAGFRLVSINPGSTVIELAPPPSQDQTTMFDDEPTTDDVVLEFYREVEYIESGQPPRPGYTDVRRTVRAVIDDAGEIGSRVEIRYKPRLPRPGVDTTQVLTRRFTTRNIPEAPVPTHTVRTRVLSGHAYMVDVEPGRQRVRVKLPDGRDLTIDVGDAAAEAIERALDQPVELEVEELVEDETSVSRVVRRISVLPSSGPGSDRPPKSLEELEIEQQLPTERPDYVALASAIWPTEADIEEFLDSLREARHAEA